MALIEFKFRPGIDKQDTEAGAENKWVDSDNVRFRYGLPEKVGGWQSPIKKSIVGIARAMHSFVDLTGNKYIAIGTDKFLFIYFEGELFDITPLATALTSCTLTITDASDEVTITKASHGLNPGDIVLMSSTTIPAGSSYVASDFDDKLFQVTSVTDASNFVITQSSASTGSGSGGSIDVTPYEPVGPSNQTYGYGWGASLWGGGVTGAVATTLNGALLDDAFGTGGVGTSITLTSTTGFPTSGKIIVGGELISYTNISGNDLTGIVRAVEGSTRSAHSNGATVTDASDYAGWGDAAASSAVNLEPGLWSLTNYGTTLIATIANGKTFSWDSTAAARLTVRASQSTSGFETDSNPTASRFTMVSSTTRHLIHFGTETTVGTPTTQDDMFIRFSDQEAINVYAPTAINTAGTQRLQDGTKLISAIESKETILIWSDSSIYTMRFIGEPFTFGFEQVGTNCGLIGKNAAVEIDGVAFWMSPKGFFAYDGTVKSISCTVEDFVFDNIDMTKGQQVFAGINNLYTEVIWWYPSTGSEYNNRYVVYNYAEKVWYTGTEPRTSWVDAEVYSNPFGTKFISSGTGTFPVIVGESGLGKTQLYEHEIGTDQIDETGALTIVQSSIKSFDIDLEQRQRTATGQAAGPKVAGEVFLAMRRFVPDFKTLVNKAQVVLKVKRYPQDDDANTQGNLSPFTITATTEKKDTRARGRFVNLEIKNINKEESWRFGTLRLDLQPDGRR